MNRWSLLLTLLASLVSGCADEVIPAGAAPGSIVGVPQDSTAMVAERAFTIAQFDSLLSARTQALVARTDSVRDARAGARPWYARWAAPLGIVLLALGTISGIVWMTYQIADRRLVASDKAVRDAEEATRQATAATRAAEREIANLRREITAKLSTAERELAEAERQLGTSRELMDEDRRASRFSTVFRQESSEDDSTPPTS